MLCVAVFAHCLSSCQWALLRRVWPHRTEGLCFLVALELGMHYAVLSCPAAWEGGETSTGMVESLGWQTEGIREEADCQRKRLQYACGWPRLVPHGLGSGFSPVRPECCGPVCVPSDSQGLRLCQCLALSWRDVAMGPQLMSPASTGPLWHSARVFWPH